jgi:hypothetical protein
VEELTGQDTKVKAGGKQSAALPYIQEGNTLHKHPCESLKYYKKLIVITIQNSVIMWNRNIKINLKVISLLCYQAIFNWYCYRYRVDANLYNEIVTFRNR